MNRPSMKQYCLVFIWEQLSECHGIAELLIMIKTRYVNSETLEALDY
jgi:hypothetical protein